MWRSGKNGPTVRWASSEWCESEAAPGVRYEIARVSLARRAEITKRVRRLLAELEFRRAGEEMDDRLAAAELEAAIDRVYVEWGLLKLDNLEIDGEQAGVASLIERGPERLAREIAARVRRECHLSGEERKN